MAGITTAEPVLQPYDAMRDPRYVADETIRWISFSDLMRIALGRKKTVLSVAAAIVVAAAAYAVLATPLYRSSASVMIDEQQKDIVDISAVLSGVPSDPSSVESQTEILQSRGLAGEVVDRFGLVKDPEFNSKAKPSFFAIPEWLNISYWTRNADRAALTEAQKQREAVIDKFLTHLEVAPQGHSTVIDIDFLAQSAAKAAKIANAIADTYVSDEVEAKADATRGASKWLTARVAQLSQQARAADEQVAQYRADNNLMDLTTGTSALDVRMSDLDNQIVLAESNRAQADAKLARVHELKGSGDSAGVNAVVDSPLITQLREQEASLIQQQAELSSRYGPMHPRMQDIQAQKRDLQAKINEEVNRVVGTVANDAAEAGAQESVLEGKLAALRAEANKQNQARVKLAALVANATSIENLYETFLQRLKQTQEQVSLNIPSVHVMSPAAIPVTPSFPKKLLIIFAAIPAGLLLGFLTAFATDRMRDGFRTPGEVEAALGLTVLGTVPELKSGRHPVRDVAGQIVSKPLSSIAETIRGLQMRLSLPHSDGPHVVVVTSALPGEGKTSVAACLARQAALSGRRAVLVDGDLRRPNVHTALGIGRFKHGLVNYLDQECMLDDALVPDPKSPLLSLPATHTRHAPELIASDQMEKLITRLRSVADLVIIDSPPVLAVNDANLLAHIADTTLFVVRWEKTPREVAMQAVKSLREVGAQLAGVVLMRADTMRYQYYNYGYNASLAYAKYFEN
jgi:capsular exopolysaccharide synthesis family protein